MDRDDQLRILRKLNQAEAFETFLQTKYVGQKRSSPEGAEAMISLLDEICQAAGEGKLDEVCIGMAHRGRLNVLANIVGKSYAQIFRELLTYMMEDQRTIGASIHLLFMARNLERMGDLATNIAETVHYHVTGAEFHEERPKRDPGFLSAVPAAREPGADG